MRGRWINRRCALNGVSRTGYNNNLKQAVAGIKLRVNNSVNSDMTRLEVRLMDGGWSKIKILSRHPFVVH